MLACATLLVSTTPAALALSAGDTALPALSPAEVLSVWHQARPAAIISQETSKTSSWLLSPSLRKVLQEQSSIFPRLRSTTLSLCVLPGTNHLLKPSDWQID